MSYGGQYNPTNPPQRNGVFINTQTFESPQVRTGANGIVGLVGQADWGPDNTIVDITSAPQALEVFGNGPLYFAIEQALLGSGSEARAGAAIVRAYRIVGSAGDYATVTLKNTDTPSVDALTLTAKYKGTRGNDLKVTTQTDIVDNTKRNIIIYEGDIVREVYTYPASGATIMTDLAVEINSRSAFVTASVDADGEPLTAVTGTAFTGGDSGASISSGDHLAARTAFEDTANFGAFAVEDWNALGSPEQTAYKAWAVRLVDEGKTFTFVVGGDLGESAVTALNRSVFLDTPDLSHTAGMGDVFVNITRDLRINGTVYSSSKMAPRVAGIIAAADFTRSISGTPLIGAELANAPSSAQVEALVRGGVVPFKNDGTTVRLDRGQTCYARSVPPTDDKAEIFRELLFTRKLWHAYERMDQLVSDEIIGQPMFNTPEMVEAIVNRFRVLLKTLEDENLIVEGSEVNLDPSKDNSGSTLHLLIRLAPARGIEQILIKVTIPV
jgi:hypothetical protein